MFTVPVRALGFKNIDLCQQLKAENVKAVKAGGELFGLETDVQYNV